jgi:hypothetical protein
VHLPEDLVHLLLRVAPSGLESLREPVEHDEPLGVDGRDRDEPAVAHERAQDARLTQEVDGPVVAPDDDPGVDEALPGAVRRPHLEPRAPLHRVGVGRAEHQRREHRSAVVVGEGTGQLPSGEGRRRHAN